MDSSYVHLGLFERQRIFTWRHYEKKSIREIGRLLNRSHTTISRELRRNISTQYVPTYYPHPAHHSYRKRMQNRARRPRLKNHATEQFIVCKLKLGWSPEIISGRLKYDHRFYPVCHESIYQYIYKQDPALIIHLARKHLKRRRKFPYRKQNDKIPHKISILERPESINSRGTLGHWESDSLECKTRMCALNVLVERTSRLVHITKVDSKKSSDTQAAILKRLSHHPAQYVQSITYDNGSENALHIEINRHLGCQSYFCQPYHSWEKGSVEQVNGLIRRFLPKGSDLGLVSNKSIHEIENLLNSRPRKCLGYKTPFEVYNENSGALAH